LELRITCYYFFMTDVYFDMHQRVACVFCFLFWLQTLGDVVFRLQAEVNVPHFKEYQIKVCSFLTSLVVLSPSIFGWRVKILVWNNNTQKEKTEKKYPRKLPTFLSFSVYIKMLYGTKFRFPVKVDDK
jgi:hypothetical protein